MNVLGSLGTTNKNYLVHDVSHFISSADSTVGLTRCGLHVPRRHMHNTPKFITCLYCIVRALFEAPKGWI